MSSGDRGLAFTNSQNVTTKQEATQLLTSQTSQKPVRFKFWRYYTEESSSGEEGGGGGEDISEEFDDIFIRPAGYVNVGIRDQNVLYALKINACE